MGNYKRKVTYFYQYHNGNIGTTAGFLKLEIRGDNVKITVNIQESSRNNRENPVLYFYHETGEKLSAVKICEVKRQGGVLTLQTKTPWREVFDTGRDLYTFDGVLVLYNENDYYLGDFDDRDRSSYNISLEEHVKINSKDYEKIFEKAYMKEQKTGVVEEKKQPDEIKDENAVNLQGTMRYEDEVNLQDIMTREDEEKLRDSMKNENAEKPQDIMPDEKTEKHQNAMNNKNTKKDPSIIQEYKDEIEKEENPFEKMLREYPKLPMYNAEELFECVRINPRDIGRLDIGNWKLGSNSFLTHGYYTYQYLMLGKMMFGDGIKHAVLGVPGVYTNREKYIANMFGFDQFIPVKKTGLKTGQFGYWIVELCQER